MGGAESLRFQAPVQIRILRTVPPSSLRTLPEGAGPIARLRTSLRICLVWREVECYYRFYCSMIGAIEGQDQAVQQRQDWESKDVASLGGAAVGLTGWGGPGLPAACFRVRLGMEHNLR